MGEQYTSIVLGGLWTAQEAGHARDPLPCGFTPSGIPVGLQIVGPQYGDLRCLAFARLLEREFQAFVPPPGYA